MSDHETYDIKGYRITKKVGTKSAYGISFSLPKTFKNSDNKENNIVQNFITERILPALSSKTQGFDDAKKIRFMRDKCKIQDIKELSSKSIVDLRKIEREILR